MKMNTISRLWFWECDVLSWWMDASILEERERQKGQALCLLIPVYWMGHCTWQDIVILTFFALRISNRT